MEAVSRKLIWFGLFVGSSLGGYLPTLFGADMFSLWALLGGTVGGVAGVFAGNAAAKRFG